MRHSLGIGSLLLGLVLTQWASAQSHTPPKSGTYTCTDSHGRRLISDRPIPECQDREQRILGPSGVERGRIAPVLTDQEKLEEAERSLRTRDEHLRTREQQRLDYALVQRYPTREVHDAERRAQLQQLEELQALARTRLNDLDAVRLQAYKDLAPYQARREQPPPALRQAMEKAEAEVAAQKRSIENHELNRQRVLLRFDDELKRLKKLWAQPSK